MTDMTADPFTEPPPVFLVCLRIYDDTYHRAYMAERMLNTPEMQKLRELARARGYHVDCERLSTIEEMERYLSSLPADHSDPLPAPPSCVECPTCGAEVVVREANPL